MTTNTPASLKYSEDSARRLLGDHLGKDHKYRDARVAAAHALIEQFRQLVDSHGVLTDKLQMSPGFTVFTPAGAQVVVNVNAENGTVVAGVATGRQLPPLPLFFNPNTLLFEGQQVDAEVTPTPGALRPRRSALAVLVERVFGQTPSL